MAKYVKPQQHKNQHIQHIIHNNTFPPPNPDNLISHQFCRRPHPQDKKTHAPTTPIPSTNSSWLFRGAELHQRPPDPKQLHTATANSSLRFPAPETKKKAQSSPHYSEMSTATFWDTTTENKLNAKQNCTTTHRKYTIPNRGISSANTQTDCSQTDRRSPQRRKNHKTQKNEQYYTPFPSCRTLPPIRQRTRLVTGKLA